MAAQNQGHLPGRAAQPAPEPPGTTRARSARPRGQTLAAPAEPAAATKVPDREDAPPQTPRWSHATGEPATRLTTTKPGRNHQLQPTLNRARPVPSHWRNAGPMLLADDIDRGRRPPHAP